MLGAWLLLFGSPPISVPPEPSVISTPPPYRATLKISAGGWNGDLVLSQSGDLQLSYDLPEFAQATFERISRLINTTPREFDAAGAPISRGDDPFHPTWGAGLPSLVDELTTKELASFVQQHILAGLSGDSGIADTPPPQVVVQIIDPATLRVSVAFSLVTGQPVSIGGYTLSISARAGG